MFNGLGHGCRHLPTTDPATCEAFDGRPIDPALVDAYEQTWVHRAHGLQRALDDGAPLLEAFVPHTHNSANSVAYSPTLSRLDHNQWYSLTDQLRMDVRGIEIDVHWSEHPDGDPAHGMRAPVMCHAEAVDPGGSDAPGLHAGCTNEDLLVEGLGEIATWLTANPDEFLILYLENGLDADPAAHAAAAAAIDATLGDVVLPTPAGEPCADMPYQATQAQILATGARVLVVGDCDTVVAGPWGRFVHDRGPNWEESGTGRGDDFDCAAERAAFPFESTFMRHWEDGTWLSFMVGGGGDLTVDEVRAMTACAVNFVGFDHLHPQDPSLEALIWSWAPDHPLAGGGDCAALGTDGRFRNDDCVDTRRHACHGPAGWLVSNEAGPWWTGFDACAALGADYVVPWNGWENGLLADAAADEDVWLNYATGNGAWTPNGPRPTGDDLAELAGGTRRR